ncbi:hypothetical protein ES703_94048 [subsurface metagenome]
MIINILTWASAGLAICMGINTILISRNRDRIEELRKYVAGLVTANILEGLKVSDKELREKLSEITDVEE